MHWVALFIALADSIIRTGGSICSQYSERSFLMKKKLFSIVALSLFAVPVVAQAASVAGGDLYFYGWQDDKKVYSEIGNNSKYMVRASVKVGSSTYTSGYKSAYAYKSANRVWYANESSWYDYYVK